jgi:hemolysin activation/secretion protein
MDEEGDGNSSRSGGSGDVAGGDFSKINLNLAHWQPLTFSNLVKNQAILARLDVQSSGDLLVSMEQMSLGGPNSVRAYPPAEYMVDSGQFFSLEWIAKGSSATKGKLFDNLQFSVFYDYASGELNDPLANDIESPEIQGYGASVQVAPENEYFARLELATPMGDPEPSNDRSLQYFFKFGYLF